MAINGMSSSSSSSSPFFPPNFLLQIQNTTTHDHQEEQLRRHQQQQQAPNPLSFLLSSNPQDYRSVATMVGKRSVSLISGCCEEAGEDVDVLSDEYCSGLAGERKRRLSMEQVRTLEKNFEIMGKYKLEPERKMQLAAALGLQPRQVAIWFQNRRARWRTKQMEKDYNALKRQLEAIKSESQALQAHNKKLQAEISSLKGRDTPEPINLNKETEGSCSNRSENSSEINLDISRGPPAAIESPRLNPHQSIPFFSTTTIRPATTMVRILQSSAAACPKIEHNSVVPDENFTNLLCSMDDQSAFWTWSDPHSFH